MPALKTRADSLREYLTGAGSDGGAQTNPNNSLGHFRSATEATELSIAIVSALVNVSVDYASGGNTLGAGTLTAVDANTVNWAQQGDAAGTNLSLPTNGSQGIAESAASAGAYLRLTRTSASAISGGPATITLTTSFNNQYGWDDVTSALATSGENEYRCSLIRNESAGTVTNFYRWLATLGTQQTSDAGHLGSSGPGTITTTGTFADWPASGWCRIQLSGGSLREIVYYSSRTNQVLTVPASGRALLGTTAAAGTNTDTLNAVPGVAVALDTNGVQAQGSAFLTIANANTAPAGVTWNTSITQAAGLNVASITNAQQVAIWVWRDIPAGAQATPSALTIFNDQFDAA